MKYCAAIAALAGTALAASLRRATRDVVHPHIQHVSAPNMGNTSYREYSPNWAGSVQHGEGFNKVQGTIVAPRATGGHGAGASAWVGIDGDTCSTAILQTGISFYGDGSYDAWYEWIPDYSHSFHDFAISHGDAIRMEVDASSKTAGVATLENLTTGQKVNHTFSNPPSTLCQTDAEWIVEDFEVNGNLIPFTDFGIVTFTDASASGSAGTVTPKGGTIYDIRDSSKNVLTLCATSGDSLTCTSTG